jgi:hypothetical protein
MKRLKLGLLIVFMTDAVLHAPEAHAQKGGAADAKLRKEIEALRADLDRALREIRDLKAMLSAKGVAPEKGPLYRGQPARYWVEQLADADPRFRLEAIDALGAMAPKDKTIVPVLLKTLQEDPDSKVGSKTAHALGSLGTDVLPALIEILKDPGQEHPKHGRARCLIAIEDMKGKAGPAAPALAAILREKSPKYVTFRLTIRVLGAIGPEAKEALPALVDALEFCLRDINKKESAESHFGTGTFDTNAMVLSAIIAIEPGLRDALPNVDALVIRTKIGGGIKGNPIRPISPEFEAAWREAHQALAKQVKRKN